MIVKRSSWHYRFRKLTNDFGVETSTNRCNWFWSTVLDIVKVLIVATVVSVIVYYFIVEVIPEITTIDVITVLMYIGMLIAMVVLPSLAIFGVRKLLPSTHINTPNMLIETYKAYKGKYCPPITFED